jgi:hypothetical protein
VFTEPDSRARRLPWGLLTLNHQVPGSSPGAPTIQSYETANPGADSR